MSLFEHLKVENIAALKAGDKLKRSTYTLLLGELGRVGDPKAAVEDAAVIGAARKIIAGITEMIAKGSTDLQLADQLAVLEALLPQMASEEDIIDFVGAYVLANPGLTMKDMGKVMSAAKEQFNGALDGKTASEIIRTALSSLK